MASKQAEEPIEPSTREWIEEILGRIEMVEWDRFVIGQAEGGRYINVYGWIDREDDEYKDFVLVRFFPDTEDNIVGYTTSSDRYTLEIHERIYGDVPEDEHNGCRRVEHTFDVENAIELESNASLSDFGGNTDR